MAVLAILPAPALGDWVLTTFTDRHGYNVVRTATGAMLGYAYGAGIGLLLAGGIVPLVVIATCYGVAALCLLIVNERRQEGTQGI